MTDHREELAQEVLNGEHRDSHYCVYCAREIDMDSEGWWFDTDGSTYCFGRIEASHVPN